MLVFFDDILIYRKSWEEHVYHVDKVLKLLKVHQLYAKPSKCAFGVQEVEYLGHIVSHEGVKVDPNKIKAIMDWPIPKKLKNLRGFLGLTGYYRKFVKHYGQIIAPLTKLLKKEGFYWREEATQVVERLDLPLESNKIHPYSVTILEELLVFHSFEQTCGSTLSNLRILEDSSGFWESTNPSWI